MKQLSFLHFSFFIILIIFVVHIFATIHYWYWLLWWLDILMHTLGGIFVGSFALYVYYQSSYLEPKHFSYFFVFFLVLSTTALIGILWEFFQFGLYHYITHSKLLTLTDTLGDLLSNLVGSIFSGIIFITTWKKNF